MSSRKHMMSSETNGYIPNMELENLMDNVCVVLHAENVTIQKVAMSHWTECIFIGNAESALRVQIPEKEHNIPRGIHTPPLALSNLSHDMSRNKK